MKNAMPPSTITAPIAIPIALEPLRPLSVEVVDELDGATVGVVAVGVGAGVCGRPGVSGLVGAPFPPSNGLCGPVATALAGAASIAPASSAAAARLTPRRLAI
jgi:hypothetical protein